MGVHPVLHISLLGEFKLVEGDKPFTTINTPRLRALLGYLLFHRDAPQPRQHIAFLFWPDSSEEQAQANLRNLLLSLRRAFADAERHISIERRTLQWRDSGQYTLDVVEFEQALARANAPDATGSASHSGSRSAHLLQQVVDLYGGDLLPACYDEWVITPRERFRQGYLQALAGLVEALEQ